MEDPPAAPRRGGDADGERAGEKPPGERGKSRRRRHEPESALDRAARLLAGRRHAVVELRRKLRRKGYSAAEVDGAIARARELGWLDDEAAARDWAAELAARGGQGRRRAERKLLGRGLEPSLVRDALAAVWSDEVERRHARAVFERLAAGEKQRTREAAGRLYRKLASRGFGGEIAGEIVRRWREEDEPDGG